MHDTRVFVSSNFRVNTKLMCPPLVIFFVPEGCAGGVGSGNDHLKARVMEIRKNVPDTLFVLTV